MTTEHHTNTGPYAAKVEQDPEIGSTVISLSYQDPAQPERNMTVGIAPELGSNMFRLHVGSHDILYYDLEALKRMDFTGNFVLWPLPNRIRDKRYTYQGQAYSLEAVTRPQGNAVLIHGLVFDRPWQYERPVVTPEGASVTTYVEMNEDAPYFASYPFPSRFSLTYKLTSSGVTITYKVENKGTKDLPFGFALHPYFSLLSGKEDTLVNLPAEAVMEADDELLPTGRVFDVNKIMYAMYDLRTPIPVGYLKLDHVYTHLHKQQPAVLDYKTQGFRLEIGGTDDFTHIVIYTPADGSPFVCVEHQTCSTDAVNFHQDPALRDIAHLLEVHPGESSSGSLFYTVKFD
jgi:aldose 1-epimerase